MRTLKPAEGVFAFYDGREPGKRFAEGPNWVDNDLELGVANYAIVDGDEALVYDTHLTPEHGGAIRDALTAAGVRRFTVLLSHWHLDHIGGGAAFADCEVIATARTAAHLSERREAIEAGSLWGGPPISPLLLPTRTFEERLGLRIGRFEIEAIHVDIHSDDAAVLWLPGERLLLAGDTLEDTITFVDEPQGFDNHLADLERLAALEPERILPAHGDPEIIGAGGYPAAMIPATAGYIEVLRRCRTEPALRDAPLADLIGDALAAGALKFYAPYEAVHRQNVDRVLELPA